MNPYARGFNDFYKEMPYNNPYADEQSFQDYERGYNEAKAMYIDIDDVFEHPDYREIALS